MHLPSHRSTLRRLSMVSAAFLAAGMALPSAFAETDIDKRVDMLSQLPDDVFHAFAPADIKEADRAYVNAGSFAGAQPSVPLDGVEVTFQGPPAPEIIYPFITNVTFDGATPTIEFEVLNEFGFGVEGVANSFRFYANKLIPRDNGLPPAWQGYNLTSDDGVENAYPTSVRDGTFTELGDGKYSFTFEQGLDEFSGIMFEPELTHRFGVETRGSSVNGVDVEDGSDNAFDIVPATGATEGIVSRNIVEQEACTACHGPQGEFGFHGGPRQDVNQCVSCHQAGAFDGTTGNSIDLSVMLHAIHSASDTYSIFRSFRGGRLYTFEDVGYPQSVSNCLTCHDPENPATPQAINVANAPTAEQCASCHTNLAWDDNGLTNANRNHLGLAQPNSTCAACHSDNGLMVSSLEEHRNLEIEAAQKIQFVFNSITNTGEGQSPVVNFSVINPEDGSFYDLATDVAFNGEGTSFSLMFAWPNTDFTNVANDDGTEVLNPGRPGRSFRIRLASDDGLSSDVIDNGNGTYTVDTGLLDEPLVVPATTPPLGSGLASLEGHPAADLDRDGVADDELPVTSVVQAFAITDPQPVMRRQVVDVAKCQDCHGENDGLAFHGGNRVDEVLHCATCHHPNATDIRDRPVDPDGVANGVNTAAPDGKESESIDMRYMIHALHGGGDYYAGGLSADDIHYPRNASQCLACHIDEASYSLPLPSTNLGITVETGGTVGPERRQYLPSAEVVANPQTDNNLSPEAATCVACHSSDVAKAHMSVRSDDPISFGNSYLLNPNPVSDPDTQARLDASPAENCMFCHGPGAFVDVVDAHGG